MSASVSDPPPLNWRSDRSRSPELMDQFSNTFLFLPYDWLFLLALFRRKLRPRLNSLGLELGGVVLSWFAEIQGRILVLSGPRI